MVGVLCGATTNTPALGAATQAMAHLGLPSGSLALATAVTYPLGVLGVIVVMVVMRKAFVKPRDLVVKPLSEDDETYIAQFVVINPALEDKTIADLTHMTHLKFIVSRLWRTGQVIIPEADTVLHINDIVMVVTTKDDEESLVLLFGKLKKNWNEGKINWNAIDAKVESRGTGGVPGQCSTENGWGSSIYVIPMMST
jgi:uncharacterized transporter YbjL